MSSIMPMIAVTSVDETRAFYVDKLGFEHRMAVVGKDGALDFCNLVLGETSVMFTRPGPDLDAGRLTGGQPVELYIPVDDVDAFHREVAGKDVRVDEPLTDQWWGDRTFKLTDPNGYRIWFFTTVGEPVPPPGTKIV